MSGLGKLSDFSKTTIFELARMSYGKHEGEKGGRGHMGLLLGGNGALRVIKFDTHGGTSTEEDAITSSNLLRDRLMSVAEEAGLRRDALVEIRRLLNLPTRPEEVHPRSLLDRSVVAQVVEKIAGKRVWSLSNAKERKANGYASAWHAMFRHVSGAVGDTSNVRTIFAGNQLNVPAAADMSVEDEELAMFGQIAHDHQDREDFYVRFTSDGLNLESAGKYNPLRSLKAKSDNNNVCQRLWDCVSDHFKGDIPASVRNALPPLDGRGLPLSARCIARVVRAVFDAEIGLDIIRTADRDLATYGNDLPQMGFLIAFENRLERLYPGIDDGVKKDAALKFAFALCRKPAHDGALTAMIHHLDVPADDARVVAFRRRRDDSASYLEIYHDVMDFLSDKRTRPTNAEIRAACNNADGDRVIGDQNGGGLTRKQIFALMVAVCWSRTHNDENLNSEEFQFTLENFGINEFDDFVKNLKVRPRCERKIGVDTRIGIVVGAGFDDLPAINAMKAALQHVADMVRNQVIDGENQQSASYDLASLGNDILSAMLPAALEKARALRPDGQLTVQTLWTALELEGECPVDLMTDEGALAFRNALYRRMVRDFPRQAAAADQREFRRLISMLAECPLRYEAFRKAMLNSILPQNSDFRTACRPQLYDEYLRAAEEWKQHESTGLGNCRHWNSDSKNTCKLPIVYTLNDVKIHTVFPSNTAHVEGIEGDPTRFSSDIPTKYHNNGLTKEQAIVVSLLFRDYDSKLLGSWGFKFLKRESDQVSVEVQTIPGQRKVKVSVYMPFLTPEQAERMEAEDDDLKPSGKELTDRLVHDYVLDENGFLHDKGLHL